MARKTRKTKRLRGTLKKWDDDRGFGFIRCAGQRDIFLHVSNLPDGLERLPRVGDTIAFSLGKDERGRPCAIKATILGVKAAVPTRAATTQSVPAAETRRSLRRQQLALAGAIVAIGSIAGVWAMSRWIFTDPFTATSTRSAPVAESTPAPPATNKPVPAVTEAKPIATPTPIAPAPVASAPASPPPAIAPEPVPPATNIDLGCNVKGNISRNSGRKLYHVPGMEDYENTRISPESGERWFCSEAAAQAAGWVRAPR